jgi:hypothetical protein
VIAPTPCANTGAVTMKATMGSDRIGSLRCQ